ncbi:MAG TPA: thrombospondin type 3 repeat-containing protein, partial [Patescibacteria group bacterium]|nr:thrombospondin type 3 repeat-containing protein [Patescibacteria group bacterium]
MAIRLFIVLLFVGSCFFFYPFESYSASDHIRELAGRIILQTEKNGEAWYVTPEKGEKYYLGRPRNALEIMIKFGTGISEENLAKIPVGILSKKGKDQDNDGLIDDLEKALGTDPDNPDTDKDGYNDKTEISQNYSPTDSGKLPVDNNFAANHAGKIFLQTEKNGEAWYINPKDGKRYFLHRPDRAFSLMKKLSIGITNKDFQNIPFASDSKKVKEPREE